MLDGRILKGVGGLYSIKTENGLYLCRPRGIFRKDNTKPVVGDLVEISVQDEKDKEGTIETIFPRKNELLRPKVSNIDISILVFSIIDPKLNLELLDKLIVLSEEQKLETIICLNKIDLVDVKDFLDIKKLYTDIGYKILFVSALNEEETKTKIMNSIEKGTVLFSGPSGVGKSSITNLFLKEKHQMETGEVSVKLGRGKHTTRHSEIFEINKDVFIVDSPGFTSVNFDHIEKIDLRYYFKEFLPLNEQCKFSNCFHTTEPDCKVISEIDKSVSRKRYNRYISFLNEIENRRI